jgi:hypothetical protein
MAMMIDANAGVSIVTESGVVGSYLEYNPRFYVHVETLRTSFLSIVTFCISVSPVYWAYAIFGVLNFGPYSDKVNRPRSTQHSTLNTQHSTLNTQHSI